MLDTAEENIDQFKLKKKFNAVVISLHKWKGRTICGFINPNEEGKSPRMFVFDEVTKETEDFQIPRETEKDVGMICDVLQVDPKGDKIALLMYVGAFMKICYLKVN